MPANGIAKIAGNYASKGVAQRGAGSATAKAIFLVSNSQFDPDVPVERSMRVRAERIVVMLPRGQNARDHQ
ncbi:hypothetical protein [Bradyrhizobium liaoningense]|uniref:hypothetical protein n=1 Tax=Bradyrhizobium liaoningense TaxID=43992 RepID=UPI001BAD234A|nr:hypothetical protein [Bradyrhizobium liaoningense]MBR1165746.1 hypothetical protein [Bradyrhizobium liaoningense]